MSSVKNVLSQDVVTERQILIKERHLVEMIKENGYRIDDIVFGQRDGDGDKVAIFNLRRVENQ